MAKFTVILLVLAVNIISAYGLCGTIQSYSACNLNYILYNKNNVNGIALEKTALLPDVKTIVLIHGWLETGAEPWLIDTRAAPWLIETSKGYLANDKSLNGINVIIVDYGFYAEKDYLSAVCFTKRIGESVGAKLNEMAISPKIVSCIGLSLGAQICGSAGRFVFTSYGEKLAEIIGLDAAGPLYDRPILLHLEKLKTGDATVVVGVYSNGNVLGAGALTSSPYADYNFFLNGGEKQPGCQTESLDCNHVFAAHIVWTQIAAGSLYFGTLCPTFVELTSGDSCTTTLILKEFIDGVTPGIYHIITNTLGKQI